MLCLWFTYSLWSFKVKYYKWNTFFDICTYKWYTFVHSNLIWDICLTNSASFGKDWISPFCWRHPQSWILTHMWALVCMPICWHLNMWHCNICNCNVSFKFNDNKFAYLSYAWYYEPYPWDAVFLMSSEAYTLLPSLPYLEKNDFIHLKVFFLLVLFTQRFKGFCNNEFIWFVIIIITCIYDYSSPSIFLQTTYTFSFVD